MTRVHCVPRRYLALWFPRLPTDRLRIANRCATPPDAPVVVTHKIKSAVRLAAVCARGLKLGLAPGLTLADARVRVPGLVAVEEDTPADRAWLERLAAGCARYTPSVAVDAPDGVILDVGGASHLWGGDRALAVDVTARFARLGMTVAHAFTDSADAARELARFVGAPVEDEAEAVRRLPVAALRLEGPSEIALRRAGLKTVGDVAARDPAAIAARFGEDAVTALRSLIGEAEGPLTPRPHTAALAVERRFAEPVAKTEYVLTVLDALLAEATAKLAALGQGGRRFEAALFRADGLVQPLAVETGRPTRDPAAAMRLFRERVEALADPIDPGFGFDMVRLAVPRTEPLGATQLRLEGGAVAEAELAALIDRLGARHGTARIRRLRPRDSHIPEGAQLSLPAIECAVRGGWDVPPPGEPPLQPIQLFTPPQRIEVIAEVPEGPPFRFRWRRIAHRVLRAEGPERIAPEWWRRKDGQIGGGLTRDYYRIEDERGGRFWIFRHGLYGAEAEMPDWYLHGLFA